MKEIGLKDSQVLLLNLAKEVDSICKRHDIPFFMVGGTMLGAIRHKGFIPWDDDMDFGVTYNHYFELIKILQRELPKRYRCLCMEDDNPFESFFFKVEDTFTAIDDPCINLPLEKKPGLSIDVFPIVSCTETEGVLAATKVNRITNRSRIRVIPQNASWIRKTIKKMICLFISSDYRKEQTQIKSILDNLPAGDCYCNIVSPHFWRIIWPHNTFDNLVNYSFESTSFLGPQDYDSYLSKCYKNYMQLPPVEKQRVHGLGAYVINE